MKVHDRDRQPRLPTHAAIYGQLTKLLLRSISCRMMRLNGTMEKPPSTGAITASASTWRAKCSRTYSIEWTDDRHGDAEERFVTVGMVEGRLLFVVYTLRAERIRIISAREAEPRERRRYHNENQT